VLRLEHTTVQKPENKKFMRLNQHNAVTKHDNKATARLSHDLNLVKTDLGQRNT